MPSDNTNTSDIKLLLSQISERFISDIKNNPPFVDVTLSLHVILKIYDSDGNELRFEMPHSALRDALSDWWQEQSEDNFKVVKDVIDNLFNSMSSESGSITFDGKTEPVPTSLNVEDSYFEYFAGDITDPGDPIIEAGATYYFNGR